MKDLYVINCCRTAIGSFGGALKNTPAVDMGAVVVKEALNRANVKPEQVDELVFGCILTAGLGQNVARQVSIKAGLPYSIPAYTVNMVCGSGMKSLIEGARSILAGDAEIIVCGGKGTDETVPEAVAMAAYLKARGVPGEDILLEAQSRNTRENLRFAKRIMEANGYQTCVLVTSNYHMMRARMLAEQEGLSVTCSRARSDWPGIWFSRVRECLSWIKYGLGLSKG